MNWKLLFSFPQDCCPMCACGPEWNELAKKRERQAFILARLYAKRNDSGDLDKAQYLINNYGFDNLEWKTWWEKKFPFRNKVENISARTD